MSIINDRANSKKACVVTFGCQQNEADSEKIKGMLVSMGYEIIDTDMTRDVSGSYGRIVNAVPPGESGEASSLGLCDVIILNTCAIREHAELKALSRTGQLKHYKNKNKDLKIGICGCMVEQEHIVEYIKNSFHYVDFIFGTREIHMFPEILNSAVTSKKRIMNRDRNRNDTDIKDIIVEDLPVFRDSLHNAKVSVMYGCDNFCSYCVVPHVRGRERSRSKTKILEEVRGLVSSGYKDIMLLGQNVNSYKDPADAGYNFADLLGDIVKIEGDYWIRFVTSHPKDVPDGLIALMGESEMGENKRIANHFHLPVQSGSNRILKLMNRKYTREYYLDLVAKLRKNVGDIAITSDIIVGFPSETEEDFQQTLDLVGKSQFDSIFPFIYSPRKNTPAADMEDKVMRKEKTDRFERLIKLQNDISVKQNKAYEGRTVKTIVDSVYKKLYDSDKFDKDGGGYLAGRTSAHKLVIFEGSADLIGSFVKVKINESRLHGLYGDIAE